MGSTKDEPPTLHYQREDGAKTPVQRPRAGSILAEDRTKTAGPYAIGEVIGRGGGGEVLLAHDRRIGRDVALKRLRSASPDEDEIGRFLREARIQARLEHPAIVPVYELGRDELGRPFFAMKRLAGKTLSEVLAVATRERMLRAFADVCRAIDYAHSRGIVHRDLKPANIVLGEFGEVYVIDWGVARVIGDAVLMPDIDTIEGTTDSGQKLGTPKYMAPEQAENPEVDRPADIYSLGVILSEILRADRPLELDALCTAMLSRDPAKRPTARECARCSGHAYACRERTHHPRREGHPRRQPLPALLDPGGQSRGDRGARRRAGAGRAARREAGGVPRSGGQGRPDERVLSPPPRLAGLRPQRGGRPALPLPRLEDGAGRLRGRDAGRARP